VLPDEVDGGVVSRYEILEEVGREHPHPPTGLEAHQKHFGGAPELLLPQTAGSLLGREREVGPRSGHKASRATQKWASLSRAGAARKAALVQAGLPLSGGDRGKDQRAGSRLRAGSLPGA
jgi:hypothetical protein